MRNMCDLGIPVELGSGVAAAQAHYRQTARPVDLSAGTAAAM